MQNENLTKAKNAKNDEFYTQFPDIQREVNAYLEYNPDVFRDKTVLLPCDDPEWSNFTKFFAQNFEKFGLKKLISTSYAFTHKREKYGQFFQPSLFEMESPQFDSKMTDTHGKIFTLTKGKGGKKKVNIDDLKWKYLEGDGDFRSDEVKRLRHEADFIITNPPFSLYREFIAWLFEEGKKFLLIGNKSSISYKEIFPLIKNNQMWSGVSSWSGGLWFTTPGDTGKLSNVPSTWFTNMEHGRRHQPLQLMTMDDNIKYSSHKDIKEFQYPHYDNYNAIEVPYTDAIPSDYDGVMGVPVTFLEKYCPEQFEILGITAGRNEFDQIAWPSKRYINPVQINKDGSISNGSKANTRATILLKEKPQNEIYYQADNASLPFMIQYARILIRKKQEFEKGENNK